MSEHKHTSVDSSGPHKHSGEQCNIIHEQMTHVDVFFNESFRKTQELDLNRCDESFTESIRADAECLNSLTELYVFISFSSVCLSVVEN